MPAICSLPRNAMYASWPCSVVNPTPAPNAAACQSHMPSPLPITTSPSFCACTAADAVAAGKHPAQVKSPTTPNNDWTIASFYAVWLPSIPIEPINSSIPTKRSANASSASSNICQYFSLFLGSMIVGVGFPNLLGEEGSLSHLLVIRLIVATTIGTYQGITDTP